MLGFYYLKQYIIAIFDFDSEAMHVYASVNRQNHSLKQVRRREIIRAGTTVEQMVPKIKATIA